jgi:DNA repair protein RecO (recombination protein O)
MVRIETEAIVVAVRPHGEHGAIVAALTPADGLQSGYVRGGRSRRLRPVLMPGNVVQAEYRARTEAQLALLSVEPAHSRGTLLAEPLAVAAVEWVCALTAATLPEGQPYPALHSGLGGLLGAVEAAPSARGWTAALARYELLLLAELGFGLDPNEIGPLTNWPDIRRALAVTGARLARDLLTGRRADTLAARERLLDRLARIEG